MHPKRQSQAEGIFDGMLPAGQSEVQPAAESAAGPAAGPAVRPSAGPAAGHPDSMPGRFALRSRRRLRLRRTSTGMIALLASVLVMCMPSAYTVESPGPTQDVLGRVSQGEVIAVSGATVHKDPGRLLLVTVSASGVPGYPVSNAQALVGWLDPQITVLPREAVVPVGQTTEEYKEESDREMSSSQDAAIQAAFAFLKRRGMDTSSIKVSMHVDDIGGPSAGMMYTLGLIDKLTEAEESGGRTIAGTGTIDKNGKVGEIGGIRLKMLGAKRDGATWFLAPAGNCDEVVGHIPAGLGVVKVSTLDEAYEALTAIGRGQTSNLAQCEA